MTIERRQEASPLARWSIIGLGSGLVALPLLLWVRAFATRRTFWFDTHPPRPPEPVDLPWVWGLAGWAFLILCTGTTALALWLDRKSDRRVEPLALIALCLAVLGHGQAISGARVISNDPHAWPVNLVGVSIWILIAAAGAGALAWVRILLSKNPVRGRMFATCALVCSLGTAWIVDRFLVEYGLTTPLRNDIELPVSIHSRLDRPDPEIYRSEILILADGATSHEPFKILAQGMEHEGGFPDEPVLIRADRRAKWSAVSRVIQEAQEARIWKIQISTRWEKIAVQTQLFGYLPKEAGSAFGGVATGPLAHVLRVSAEGVFHFDDEPIADRAALCDRLDRLPYERYENEAVLRIEPEAESSWGHVVDALTAALHAFTFIQLGPYDLGWN